METPGSRTKTANESVVARVGLGGSTLLLTGMP